MVGVATRSAASIHQRQVFNKELAEYTHTARHVFGARPLKRNIQKLVQDPLALRILSGEVPNGSTVTLDADASGAGVAFAISKPPAAPAAPPTAAASAPAPSGIRTAGEERIAMTNVQQKMAAHMIASIQTSPHVAAVHEVDMTAVVRQVKQPCFGFKILAAGRACRNDRRVREAFKFAFTNIKPTDAVIVGTALKVDGLVSAPVDARRARAFAAALGR